MAWIAARDVSQYQGTIDWSKVSEQIVMIKIGGGDAGMYFDTQATKNYYGAKKSGKSVGGYWFAGGTNPVAEADYFIKGMSPLAPGDVMALDWEVQHANPVQWCQTFMNEVHNKTGVWPLLYINASTCNAYDWEPILKNCGLWIADYAVLPTANVPIKYPYVMHQYTSTPYDKDAWFGTVKEFQDYGFKPQTAKATVTTTTTIQQAPTSIPVVQVPTTPTQVPVKTSTTPPVQDTTPLPAVPPAEEDNEETTGLVTGLVNAFKGKKTYITGLAMLATSAEKYFTGDHTLSQYLTTVQGLMGSNGLAVIALRAAVSKLESKV